jgi:hypothetical protein
VERTGQSNGVSNGTGNATKVGPVATLEHTAGCVTIQKVGKSFELGCPECTCLTGRLGLVRQDGSRIRLHCRVHPENFGEWRSEPDLEAEKPALAGRIGLM